MNELNQKPIGHKVVSETRRVPIRAGMGTINGSRSMKIQRIGYRIVKTTYDVNIYDRYEDSSIIAHEIIKTVITV